jgi:Bacterial SH3 domain
VNKLALVPCLVVASYVAVASFIASPILYELGRPRVGLKFPTSVANRGEIRKDSSTKQAITVQPSNEVPNEALAIIEKPAAAVLPETPYHQSTWVMVLIPARVHTGPSVDTPIIQFYPVGTPLRATRYQRDWFEIIEPSTSKTGWIYRKYLGAISDSEQSKIASQEAQGQGPVDQVSVRVKRYAKAIPVKRYAKAIPVRRYADARSSKQSTHVKPVTPKPIRGRTEMASLLQRAFSGY